MFLSLNLRVQLMVSLFIYGAFPTIVPEIIITSYDVYCRIVVSSYTAVHISI